MEHNENNLNNGISLLDIANKLLEKWYIIAITVAVFLASTFIYVQFISTPMYSSTAKLFIFNTENSQQQGSGEITISTYLAKDYAELITDRTVLEEVIKNLDLDYSYASLRNSITVNNPDNTRILEITVETDNANQSKRVADEVCRVAQEKIVDLMGIGRVNIISNGFVPKKPSSPLMLNSLLNALLISLVVSISVIVVIYLTSDKIDSPEDIEKYLGMSVLATIPYSSSTSKKTSRNNFTRTVRKK
ncbi:MAG: hypothetical protein IKK24_03585 [Clostridia bacterium]|nr:hypothetical protein [Clostridia bacterium]